MTTIAALTTILGALAGFAPALIQYFTAKANNAQQLALETLRLQAAREGTALQIDLATSQAGIEQDKRVYEFASGASGNRFVDALAVFVRPFITLVMFHVWGTIKGALVVYAINKGYDLGQITKLIWDEPDQAIFGAIMGFWFGDRMAIRGGQRMAATLSLTQPAASVKVTPPPVHGGIIPKPAGSRD
jgi:hypothetical protein